MKKASITLVSILLVFIACFTVLLSTSIGFRTSLWLTQKILPGKLTYLNATGLLIGPIKAEQVVYQSKDMSVEIDHFNLQWSLISLLAGKIHIEDLNAKNIRIQQKTDSKNSATSFPLTVQIDKADIKNILYNKKYRFPEINIKQLDIGSSAVRGDIFIHLLHPYPVVAELKLGGNINAYQFNLNLKNKQLNWRLHGTGTNTSVNLISDEAHTLGGKLNANIHLDWKKDITWDARINIQNLELKHIVKQLPQRLSLYLISKGDWKKPNWPLFTIDADLKSGTTQVIIKGEHEKNWNLNWNVNIPTLSHWWPSLQGVIRSNGTAEGPTHTPTVKGKLNASGIVVGNYEVSNINAEGRFDLSYKTASHVLLKAKNILTPKAHLDTLDIDAKGIPHSHTISANIYTSNQFIGKTNLYLNWKGRYAKNILALDVKKINLSSQHFGRWTLNHETKLSLSKQKITFTPMCWHSNKGRACFKGGWSINDPWQLGFNFQHINLTPFFEKIRPGLSMRGTANLTANAHGDGKKITGGNLLLKLNKARLHYNGPNGVTIINFNQASWRATLQKHTLQSTLTVNMDHKDKISAQLNLPNFDRKNLSARKQAINGLLKISLSQLKIFNLIIPDIFKPRGKLAADLNISGTLAKPILKGKAHLINGSVAITEAKINLTSLNADIEAKGPKILYRITARSLNTPVTIRGETDFYKTGFPTKLHINANNLLVMNTVEYQIYASPNLEFSIDGNKARLNGSILIPKAILSPISFSGTVSLPDDTTIIGNNAEQNEPLIFESHVTLKMGSNVQVKARGLRGKLRGRVTLTREKHQAILGNGQLHLVGGSFTTHGKTLKISEGSGVSYTHTSLFNPDLNVKATKSIKLNPSSATQGFSANNITVGVQIAGTLKHPIWSLFSIPSTLSQADILSYLLFGQASNTNTPGNISLLLNAITSLNLDDNAPGGAASKISQTLGLTEFGVEQNTSIDALGTPLGHDQSSFVVGRYISPKIYVRYSRALLTPVDIFQVRYLFNKNWAVQSEVSTLGQGGDVLYTIQRK